MCTGCMYATCKMHAQVIQEAKILCLFHFSCQRFSNKQLQWTHGQMKCSKVPLKFHRLRFFNVETHLFTTKHKVEKMPLMKVGSGSIYINTNTSVVPGNQSQFRTPPSISSFPSLSCDLPHICWQLGVDESISVPTISPWLCPDVKC